MDGEGEDDDDIMSSHRPAAVGHRTQLGTQPTTSANECTPAQTSTDEGGTGTNEGSQVSSASPSTTPPSTPY